MFSFGSGVVNWSNKKQPIIALSNTKAKYRGVTIVACEVICIKTTFRFGIVSGCSYCHLLDNISRILLVNNLVYHARTKHIEVHYHFIREKILAKEIDLIHVSTEDQVTNISQRL
jgi:hypothetical protein